MRSELGHDRRRAAAPRSDTGDAGDVVTTILGWLIGAWLAVMATAFAATVLMLIYTACTEILARLPRGSIRTRFLVSAVYLSTVSVLLIMMTIGALITPRSTAEVEAATGSGSDRKRHEWTDRARLDGPQRRQRTTTKH